ncbi:hypothetical protein V9T40_004099 [Parthenolecanium corni]|uniref:DJ-1/PfpI domain-containing protein n=1 Tax=Parthenolecanium corni TaxID=536013 RepID=A0AAN9TVI7_9HEMI
MELLSMDRKNPCRLNMAGSKKCIALLAEGSEELELVASVDVLRRAGFDVTVAGVDGSDSVKCSRNVVICPDVSLSEVVNNDYDLVVIPGGLGGVKKFQQSELVRDLLKKQEDSGRVIAAICAGPTVLKTFSIALKKKLTSYPSVKNELVNDGSYDYSEDKVVVDGNLITSRGPGTAIDFALAIVKKFFGEETRSKIAKGLLYE